MPRRKEEVQNLLYLLAVVACLFSVGTFIFKVGEDSGRRESKIVHTEVHANE